LQVLQQCLVLFAKSVGSYFGLKSQ
jgi:hypothetical protein